MTKEAELTKEEANGKLADILAQASQLICDAETLADKYGLGFNSPIGEYGMGGYYQGDEGGWMASSQDC